MIEQKYEKYLVNSKKSCTFAAHLVEKHVSAWKSGALLNY
jgi:hypothetical protein